MGVDPDKFKGAGFENGFDPLWADLLQKHEERPIHCLVGGGDQLYCDSYVRVLARVLSLTNSSLLAA